MPALLRQVALVLLLASPVLCQTGERIRSFDSQITVNADSSLTVRETMVVNVTGNKIHHGIYRDFPTRYKDHFGNNYEVGFSIVSLERDGGREPYRTDQLSNGVRTYFGSSQQLLPPGEHNYVFSYSVTRELGFFPDHDELYWNVTGNGWDFPIDAASATVILPPGVAGTLQQTTAFTGLMGERGDNFTASKDDFGNPTFSADSLGVHQGLTIVLTWPKGLIAAPTAQQELSWFFHDNQAAFVGATGVAVVFAYFLLVWMKVGRDPRPGTIMPLYEPPSNLSPAAVRYLKHMGFDNKGFAAAILGLAGKGVLKIRRDESLQYEIINNEAGGRGNLLPEENLLARELFDNRKQLYLAPESQSIISRAQTALSLSLKTSMENVYFVTNSRYLWPGVVLTIVFLGLLLITQAAVKTAVGLFMSVWLTFWTIGVTTLLTRVYQAWRSAIRSKSPLIGGGALFLTAFSIPFVAGECFGAFMLYKFSGIPTFASAVLMLGCNVLFYFLLKAPTLAGRQLLDRIDGFKMFLGATEGDPNFVAVRKTPELFERFLPYAFALDMDLRWAEQFSQVLGLASSGPGSQIAYCPSWYSGIDLASFSATSFTQSFSDSLSSAVSSAASPPGSSSGSSSGSSGGGGGGGGGGGW